MFRILFLLFLIIPLIEIAILIQIGQIFGIGYTIALVIGTAALGAALFRQQGLSTLAKVQMSMDEGNLPATELIEGLMLLIAGALLLTPGFFTDVFGFLVLIPPLRNKIAQSLLINFIQSHINAHHHKPDSGRIIDAEHWESDSE
ncbi:MAG: FxsA family protein [Proteobacteria bacterium]|nr:FxsA family protein [Pseudomonadota bacterium]NOG60509.1 FxsA family protein [Pseudomonadota bacterium]